MVEKLLVFLFLSLPFSREHKHNRRLMNFMTHKKNYLFCAGHYLSLSGVAPAFQMSILHLDNAFISFCHRNLFETRAQREKRNYLLVMVMDLQKCHAAKLFYHAGANKVQFHFLPARYILISYCNENLYICVRSRGCNLLYLLPLFESSKLFIFAHESESPAARCSTTNVLAERNPTWCRSIEMLRLLQRPLGKLICLLR